MKSGYLLYPCKKCNSPSQSKQSYQKIIITYSVRKMSRTLSVLFNNILMVAETLSQSSLFGVVIPFQTFVHCHCTKDEYCEEDNRHQEGKFRFVCGEEVSHFFYNNLRKQPINLTHRETVGDGSISQLLMHNPLEYFSFVSQSPYHICFSAKTFTILNSPFKKEQKDLIPFFTPLLPKRPSH